MGERPTRPEVTEPGVPGVPAGAADPTLIDALRALSPEERLRLNDRMAQTIEDLRHGFAAAEPHHAAGTPGGERR